MGQIGIERKILQFLNNVLFKQDDLVESATYRQFLSSERDPVTKETVDVTNDTPILVVSTGDDTFKTALEGNMTPIRGRGYVVRSAEMPASYDPDRAMGDVLIMSSKAYTVSEVTRILTVAFFIKVER